ncbi:MAG: NAD(P)/FAD-dependent oxidoreductase [Betaproteobacteria bacterium]|nr:NAD(P)/FAD-dependent oxidoreductase [Betaproteobacteria bacterium]
MSAHAIVIGAGANELVAAHYLARAGRKVTVIEAYTMHDAEGWIPPPIVRDLGLDGAGLKVGRADPWLTIPLPDGGRLALPQDVMQSAEAIRRVSPHDAERWPAFCARMASLARMLQTLYEAPPPDPTRGGLRERARQARLGLRLRGIGRKEIAELFRVLPMSVADWLDDWFETDALKGALGAAGIRHLRHGPRAGGTAFALLHRHVGEPPGVFRPATSNVMDALAKLPGIEIRRGVEISGIEVRAGTVAGVTLASGEHIAAPVVVSGLDPRRTLLDLVDPGWLDPELVRALRNIRSRGVSARVDVTVARAPGFAVLAVAPSLDFLERASDDAKYGRISREPYLEVRAGAPTVDGRYRLNVHVQYAPYALAEGDWDAARRSALGDMVVHSLAAHLSGGDDAVTERSVLTPRDLEGTAGWPEGQPHHAELALDQFLWMRPVPALARYRTPVAGLFLCGPAMHPGGGVGVAGAHATREILRR